MVSYEDMLYRQIDVRGVDKLIEEHARLANTMAIGPAQSWQEIRIEGLTFTHQEGEDVLHTLHEVGLTIQAEQKIALIGESGSGKNHIAYAYARALSGAAGESICRWR